MGKRSNFERNPRDFYPTPKCAVTALSPHLVAGSTFEEPCAGAGDLVDHLEDLGLACLYAGDIHPLRRDVHTFDVYKLKRTGADQFITNPPWPKKIGEPTVGIALHLSAIAPTWLLLSSDFAHNKYFQKLQKRCVKIVSVGRVSWMGNGVGGMDNCAWYLFDVNHTGDTVFYGRAAA